ncbi:aspartate-semialdehyde dehydrogenase [Streptomyces sp. NPDC088812]|uniref:aspartate-semialdehyde dehydrogenase n=1 Tax=Streptomyces sp. NPDC088812 TaxID=3365905 RepID=UPI0037F15F4F
MDSAAPRIVLVGATGVLGTAIIELIEELGIRHREIRLVASDRSAGREIPVDGRLETVRSLADFDFAGADLVLFCTAEAVSRRYVPVARAQGALVVDSSGAYRTDPDTLLLVPPVNGHLLERPPFGVLAGPGALTVPLVRLLHCVEQYRGVRQVVMSSYQAASAQGRQGIEELLEGSELALRDPDAELPADLFRPALAFNVVPVAGRMLESGASTEEQRIEQETRRILSLPHLDISANCVQVPVVNGHAAAVFVEAALPVERAELAALLAGLPRVVVHGDRPGAFPTPLTAGDPDRIHVGRIRVVPHNPRAFWLWLIVDNLRAGAALNLLQIAEAASARRRPGAGARLR